MVIARVASLHEIETYWSIGDLLDANDALDVKYEFEEIAREKSERGPQ